MVQLEQQGWKINHCPTTVRLMAHQSETQGIHSIYKTCTFSSKSANAMSSPGDGEMAAPLWTHKDHRPAPPMKHDSLSEPLPSSGTLSPPDTHKQGSMSSRYSLTFFVIPIILLIMDEKENKGFSYLCLAIMSGMFLVKPIYIASFSSMNRYIGYKIDSFLYLALFIILCADTIIRFIRKVRCKNEADRCSE